MAHLYGDSKLAGEDVAAHRDLQIHHGKVSLLSKEHPTMAELTQAQFVL